MEFKDLPVEVREIIKQAHMTGLCLDNYENRLDVRYLGDRLFRAIEALWPEFGEGKEEI